MRRTSTSTPGGGWTKRPRTPSTSWGGLFGGDQSGYVYSLDSAGGTQNWTGNLSAKANGIQAAVSAQLWQYSNAAFKAQFSGDVIFAGSRNNAGANCGLPAGTNNNKVFAINTVDGSIAWTFNDTCTSSVDYVAGQPWVDYGNNRLFVTTGPGSSQPTLWVLNSLNGSLLGSLSNLGSLDSSPTLLGSTLYVASSGAGTLCVSPSSSCLYAIDVTPATVAGWPTNAVKWSVSLGAFAVRGFVWDSGGGTLYFATTDGNVWCVKQSDGTGCSGWPAGGKVQVGAPGTPIPLDYLYDRSSTDLKIHQLHPDTGADMKQYPASAAPAGTATPGASSTETDRCSGRRCRCRTRRIHATRGRQGIGAVRGAVAAGSNNSAWGRCCRTRNARRQSQRRGHPVRVLVRGGGIRAARRHRVHRCELRRCGHAAGRLLRRSAARSTDSSLVERARPRTRSKNGAHRSRRLDLPAIRGRHRGLVARAKQPARRGARGDRPPRGRHLDHRAHAARDVGRHRVSRQRPNSGHDRPLPHQPLIR